MKKSIKSILGVTMSICVALSLPMCYAVKGGKGHKKGFSPREALAACLEISPDEVRLRDLRLCVEDLISCGGDVGLRKAIWSELADIKDSTDLICKFSKFLMSYIESKKSDKSIYDGTILFLSIVKSLRSSSPVCDRNLYLRFALLTLEMCTTQGEDMYRRWYKLLESDARPVPLGMKESFKKFKIKWHADLLNVVKNQYAYHPIAEDITQWFYDSVTTEHSITKEQVRLILIPILRQNPLFAASNDARQAIEDVPRFASASDIAKAAKAVKAYEEAVNKLTCCAPPEYIERCRSELKEMQKLVKSWQESIRELESGRSGIESFTYAAVRKMLSEKSPESIEAAKAAVNRYRARALECGLEGLPLMMLMRNTETNFNELIDWVENYLKFIHPYMVAADKAIENLSATSSDELFRTALDAQEKFRKALDDHRPTSTLAECMSALSPLFSSGDYRIISPIIQPEITEDFESLKQHLERNKHVIADLLKAHAALVAAEKCDSDRRKRLGEWKSIVDVNRQSKDEEKRCGTERTESPKKIKPSDIVFFHGSETPNPLKFITDHSQYIAEWNKWYKNAQDGVVEGNEMELHSTEIYENKTGRDLEISQKDGHPALFEYKGGGAVKNKSQGFRILFYVEKDSNRIVIVYIGKPFGESHDNPWKTLVMTPEWVYEHVDMISK